MAVLSTIVLIMLTMVGYSSGITLASRGKNVLLAILDLAIVLALWVVALSTRDQLLTYLLGSRFLLLTLWLVIGLLVGYLKALLSSNSQPEAMPDTELPEHVLADEEKSANVIKRAWEGWKSFAAEMGHVQGELFMGFFYFIIVTVFGIGVKMFSDPMAIKSTPAQTGWVDRKALDKTLEQAQEQGQA